MDNRDHMNNIVSPVIIAAGFDAREYENEGDRIVAIYSFGASNMVRVIFYGDCAYAESGDFDYDAIKWGNELKIPYDITAGTLLGIWLDDLTLNYGA